MGGLGNQLFQIFTTIAYGIREKRQIVFSYFDKLTIGIERPTYWENFLLSIKMMTTFNPGYRITNGTFVRFSNVFEKEFTYSEIPSVNYKEILLHGYFQSYKYFEEYKQRILSLLRFNVQQNTIRQEYAYLFQDGITTISMHFRLGDYVHIQDCHPLLKFNYYENSLHHIVNSVGEEKICVLYFCQKEDNTTVSMIVDKVIERYPNIQFIKVDDEIPDWKQMLLMSCCNHNIIANSTFSWWGAYFNQNKEKIVCYPQHWFGPKIDHDTKDLFPIDWIQIL
jgi:hypothetical protein